MSSAILYLAIIAIWAGFLLPAWLRRPHAAPDQSVEHVTETENDVEVSVEADIHVEVTHHEHAEGYADQPPSHADMDYAVSEGYEVAGAGGPSVSGPSQRREQMLRARRRMLTILVAMTLVTGGFAFVGKVQWWICVPPAVLLALYVLLLREIAQAEAELARKRAAWEAAEARAYEQDLEAQAEREAYQASLAHSGAQIIDISGRYDQLYDQYADAAIRAVGD